jgi:4'-phosphopantetheinyl transferase
MQTVSPARTLERAPFTYAIAHGAAVGTDFLTRAERSEYDALRYDVRRRDWLAGRYAAKRAVARRRGLSIDRLSLETRAGAAPSCSYLAHGSRTALSLTVSIGHCAGIAIAAASDRTTSIGVDIEREDTVDPHECRLFLGAREHAIRSQLDATLAWVLKEAAWKALRLRDDIPFAALELDLTNDARLLRGVRIAGDWRPARVFIIELPRALRLRAAVVVVEAA